MHEQDMGTERRVLFVSAGGNLLIGVIGVLVAVYSKSQAILLDGLFNLSYFAAGLFALKVAALVKQGDDQRFPLGYAFFEPLINGMKGVLVLGISFMALVGALQALFAGGRTIAAGMAVAYGIFAAASCWILAAATRRGAKRSGSPLLVADAQNWLVNGAISSAVLLAFAAILIIRNTALAFLVPYIDPSLVLIVVTISISIPVRIAWQALMELLNRAPTQPVVQEAEDIVKKCTAMLLVQKLFVRMIQPGRSRMILVHVVLPADYAFDGLPEVDAIRAATLQQLQKIHPATTLDIVFTADPFWGEPAGQRVAVRDIQGK